MGQEPLTGWEESDRVRFVDSWSRGRCGRWGPAPERRGGEDWPGARVTLRLGNGHHPGSGGSPGTQLDSCPQEACERSLAEMESSHQQVMAELQRHHERELQRLQQEKEWLLAEETAATASGEDPGPHQPPAAGPR